MHSKLGFKIISITTLILMLTIAGSSIINGILFFKEYNDALYSRASAIGFSLKSQLDHLLNLGISLAELSGFENQCQALIDQYDDISYVMVVDPVGKILFHSDPHFHDQQLKDPVRLQGEGENGKPIIRKREKFSEVIILISQDGNFHLGTIHIAFLSTMIQRKLVHILLTSSASVAATALVFIFLLCLLLRRQVTRPLDQLVDYIQAIREDRSKIESMATMPRKDEIGILYNVFRELVRELNISQSHIETHAKELETNVKERTKRLQEINSEVKEEISKREVIKDNLQTTLVRLNEAQRLAKIGNWELDLIQSNLTWSEEIFCIFEIDPEKFDYRYETFLKAVHPEDRHVVETAYSESVTNHVPYDIVHRLLIDGSIKYVHEIGKTEYSEAGTPLRSVGTVQDITELKKTEEELEKNQKRLGNIIQSANIGTWEWNVRTGETRFNQRWAEIVGYTLKELSPVSINTWMDLVQPDDLTHSDELLDKHFSGELQYYNCEARMKHKEGHWVWVLDRGKIVSFTSEGKPEWFFGTRSDITDRKIAELSLIERNEMIEHLTGQLSEAVWFTDLDGITIREANHAFENLYSMSKDQINSDPTAYLDFVHPDDREIVETSNQELWEKGHAKAEFRLKRLGDEIQWIHERKTIIFDHEGHPLLIGSIGSDITEVKNNEAEEKKLRQQLVQAQKMESIGRLAGGVAHDYNNALSAIIGFSELAMEQKGVGEVLHDYLKEILRAANRAKDITRQLLGFARKQMINPKMVNPNKHLEGLLVMLRRLLGEDIDLSWTPKAELWSTKIDPSQLDQIMLNICLNSRDAIEGVGKISIETNNITFDEAHCAKHAGFIPGEYALISISDDGCGMEKEIVENIFEPFFTTKGIDKGTGLGLSTTYGIVKQNHGFINVYSEPGIGTTFKIYLRRHLYDADISVQEVNSTKIISEGKDETILAVEDDPFVMEVVKRYLNRLQYKVLTATTPTEAIDKVVTHNQKIDLLLTDVTMPQMNGYQLSQQILKLYPDIKILFMSGYTAQVIVHQGVLNERTNFIEKPFSLQKLATAIRDALNKKS